MKWFNRVANRFRSVPKYERAAVRLEKLEKWVDLQFRSVLEPVQKQLNTNFESLKEHITQLDGASISLSQAIVSQAKIHIHQLTLEHRKLLINGVHAITSTVKSSPSDTLGVKDIYDALAKPLAQCDEIMARAQKSLYELLPEHATRVETVLKKVHVNVKQANDIFEDSDYQLYLSVQRGIYNIHRKMEQVHQIQEVVTKREENIKQLLIEADRLKLKMREIKHDPRYRHEQEAVKNPATRYRNSFYELDLQDIASKLDLVEQKIAANKKDLSIKLEEIKGLNLDAEKHAIFSKLKKRLGIELEIVE